MTKRVRINERAGEVGTANDALFPPVPDDVYPIAVVAEKCGVSPRYLLRFIDRYDVPLFLADGHRSIHLSLSLTQHYLGEPRGPIIRFFQATWWDLWGGFLYLFSPERRL